MKPLHVGGQVDVHVGSAHLVVRGAGRHLDVHLPGPRHWPALWRHGRGTGRLLRRARPWLRRADLRCRLCWRGVKIPV